MNDETAPDWEAELGSTDWAERWYYEEIANEAYYAKERER